VSAADYCGRFARPYAVLVEFNDVIKKRRMVRAFTTEPVDPQVAERILAAANRAPSAGFSQGYALLVLDQPDQLGPFWELMTEGDDEDDEEDQGRFDPVTKAPLVIVPLSCKDSYLDRYAQADKGWTDRDEAHWPVPYWDIDTGFLALLMLLAAVDEGLGALFFGIMPSVIGRFREVFSVPGQYMPIGAVAIGHADPARDQGGSARVIKRRELGDLVHRGRW
jgi:nitroreductase